MTPPPTRRGSDASTRWPHRSLRLVAVALLAPVVLVVAAPATVAAPPSTAPSAPVAVTPPAVATTAPADPAPAKPATTSPLPHPAATAPVTPVVQRTASRWALPRWLVVALAVVGGAGLTCGLAVAASLERPSRPEHYDRLIE